MRVEQFLERLEQQQLLPEKLLASLRQQVQAGGQFTAEAVAKQLVSKGRLTEAQAQTLLADDDELILDPMGDDDLGLAPLDDELGLVPEKAEKKQPPPAAPKPPTAAKESAPAAAKPKAAAQPTAASLLDEELGGGLEPLDSLLGDPLAAGGLGDPLAAADSLGEAKGKKDKKGRKRDKSKSQWDTPLMLVGGGLLVFLVLAGGVLLFFINRGGGDEQLKVAEDFYREGSYTQAIVNYDEFLKSYETHPQASLARVHRGLARLRQATEGTSNFPGAFETAQRVIHEIENEPEFTAARDELRALLPNIAEGLAEQAKAAQEPDQVPQLIEQSRAALVLVANTKYVPKSVRPVQRIEHIEGILNVVERDLKRDAQLQETLAKMAELAGAGKTADAYAVRRTLLRTYPDLKENPALAEAVAAVSQAEMKNLKVVEQPLAALTTEPAAPYVAALAIADRRIAAPAGSGVAPVFVRVQGAVYGLNRADGRLLWRRWAGHDPLAAPVASEPNDVFLVDADRNELVRLAGADGRLNWRLPLEEPMADPTVARDQTYVATRGGKLFAVDSTTGESTRHAVFSQALRTSPAVHPRADCLYQVGEHSNLYVLAAQDLSCQEVLYLGHDPGTVTASPVVAGNAILVAENWGANDATLHVVAADAQGKNLKLAQQVRLQGHVVAPPLVSGRQVVVATTRGEIRLFEISTASTGDPLIPIVQRAAEEGDPLIRYLALQNNRLWVGDKQLGQYVLQAASGRLVPQSVDQPEIGDIFDGPLQIAGDFLIYSRRRQGRGGTTLAAVNMSSGKKVWEVDLAAPPAGAPLTNLARREISLVTANSAVFRFDAAAIKARVQDQPLPLSPSPTPFAPLVERVDLSENAAVFTPAPGGQVGLVYAADQASNPARWIKLPSPLACTPSGMGGRLLAPVALGQVLLWDAASGRPHVEPFQPRLEPGAAVEWRTPGVVEGKPEAVITDGRAHVYRVGVKADPTPHLEAVATSEPLTQPLTSPVAVLGDLAMAVDASGALMTFNLADLKARPPLELGGQAVWGPFRVGPLVLLVNELDELTAIDAAGQIAWRQPLADGPLSGPPIVAEETLVCVARTGVVVRRALASGEAVARLDLEHPLASGAAPFGPHFVAAGHDGTLLVFKLPEKD